MEFNPRMQDLIMRGHASRSILDAVETFCDVLVGEAVTKLCRHVNQLDLSPEQALAVCHEIAAYRRITDRLKQQVHAGEKAELRQRADHEARTAAERIEEPFA